MVYTSVTCYYVTAQRYNPQVRSFCSPPFAFLGLWCQSGDTAACHTVTVTIEKNVQVKTWCLVLKSCLCNKAVLQIRAVQCSITANLWSLTTHIYHVMIIATGGFSKKSFFIIIFRSSCTEMFFKTGAIRNFAIFTGKHLCWNLF